MGFQIDRDCLQKLLITVKTFDVKKIRSIYGMSHQLYLQTKHPRFSLCVSNAVMLLHREKWGDVVFHAHLNHLASSAYVLHTSNKISPWSFVLVNGSSHDLRNYFLYKNPQPLITKFMLNIEFVKSFSNLNICLFQFPLILPIIKDSHHHLDSIENSFVTDFQKKLVVQSIIVKNQFLKKKYDLFVDEKKKTARFEIEWDNRAERWCFATENEKSKQNLSLIKYYRAFALSVSPRYHFEAVIIVTPTVSAAERYIGSGYEMPHVGASDNDDFAYDGPRVMWGI